MPDMHCDDHDLRAVKLAIKLCKAYTPSRIIFLGDLLDCYWASSFHKKRGLVAGAYRRERDAYEAIMPHFKAPHKQILLGNHEDRILKFLDKDGCEALMGCDDFNLHKVLSHHGEVVVDEDFIELAEGNFIVTHGNFIGERAGKEEMATWGVSGASGHTHSLVRDSARSGNSVRTWVQCGHLSNNPPRYRKRNAPGPQKRWLQGVAIMEVDGDGFFIQEIPFTMNYRAWLGKHMRKYNA